ncbi:MAG: YidC/Oxa1 family membrane protein insertase [Clostridium sp.]|nr:YidC/Oxa1 family membrane protein insertase [Clostridium sp.]
MDVLFKFTSSFNCYNLGICIILFTVITKILLFPLTIKQQENTRLMKLMNPEIQAIQKKYKGKTDQTSMARQNAEMQAVYEKYGSNPTAGCLPLLIQLPIIFALYRVIYNIPAYVPSVKTYFETVAAPLMKQPGFDTKATAMAEQFKVLKFDASTTNSIIDLLYKLTNEGWADLQNSFPAVFTDGAVQNAVEVIHQMNDFFGINLAAAPFRGFTSPSVAWLIPILAGLTQFLSTKMMDNGSTDPDQPGAAMMNQMMITMPLVSVFICFTLPAAIGIYWVVQGALTLLQQMFVNRRMDKIDVNELVAKNVEKINKKRAKKGLPAAKVTSNANASLRTIEQKEEKERRESEETAIRKSAAQKQMQESKDFYEGKELKPGSIAAKARMVKNYNEKNTK